MSKLRLLFSSNIMFCKSGYGTQSVSILNRLAKLPEFGGKDSIAQFAWYGLQGAVQTLDGFRIYPAGADPYGNDIIESHTKHFKANIVLTLIDIWVLRDHAKKVAPALFLPWFPIDSHPVPQKVLDSLQGAYLPLTYSKWGHDLLTRTGVKNEYIAHGIETGTYFVNPDRAAVLRFKQRLTNLPHSHLTCIVAANKGFPDRKAFQVQVRAWANFARDKPHARLYIHTEPTPMYGGLDMLALTDNLGISAKVIFPDRYENFIGFPEQHMAMIYNAADVQLAASMSEGFGIPIIESQSCGSPVVTTDFSSMPELVRWGYAIPPADMFWTPMNTWQAWPDALGISDALGTLYAAWEKDGGDWAIEKRMAVSAQIHAEYSWDSLLRDQWAPLMTRLAEVAPPLEGAKVMVPVPSMPVFAPRLTMELIAPPMPQQPEVDNRGSADGNQYAFTPPYDNGVQPIGVNVNVQRAIPRVIAPDPDNGLFPVGVGVVS